MAYSWDNRVNFIVKYIYDTNVDRPKMIVKNRDLVPGRHKNSCCTMKMFQNLTAHRDAINHLTTSFFPLKQLDAIVKPSFSLHTDSNGKLTQHDFECMALKMTIMEGKGEFSPSRFQENLHIMLSLWDEISQLADFNKDGIVTVEEFKDAVQKCCIGRSYCDFPQAMKMFIDNHFRLIDINDDGVIAAEEYRYNCVSRIPVHDITALDEAYQNLLNDEDRKRGGITLSRYQELYAQFLGNPDENNPAVHLFGPLHELC